MRALLVVFLLIAPGCGRDRLFGTFERVEDAGDSDGEASRCTGCPCCCARSPDAHGRWASDGGDLPTENAAECTACVLFAASHGDAGDQSACTAIQ